MLLFLYLGWGLYSFPIAMCIANLPYNSWKWTVKAYRLLNMNNYNHKAALTHAKL